MFLNTFKNKQKQFNIQTHTFPLLKTQHKLQKRKVEKKQLTFAL